MPSTVVIGLDTTAPSMALTWPYASPAGTHFPYTLSDGTVTAATVTVEGVTHQLQITSTEMVSPLELAGGGVVHATVEDAVGNVAVRELQVLVAENLGSSDDGFAAAGRLRARVAYGRLATRPSAAGRLRAGVRPPRTTGGARPGAVLTGGVTNG